MPPDQFAALQRALADRYALEVITADGVPETERGHRWYDTRPMLDEREHSLPTIDQAREVLAYAHERGLISPHPQHAHLVRITRA